MPTIILHADQDHDRLRAVMLVLILLCIWLGYQLLYKILFLVANETVLDYAVFLSCAGGVPIGLALAWGSEKLLKRIWHSGNNVTLQADAILVQPQEMEPQRIEISDHFDVLQWYFPLSGYPRSGSERRVPKNWYCLATQIQQGESRFIVYTFIPSRQVTAITQSRGSSFQEIHPADVYAGQSRMSIPSRPEIPAEVLRGKDGRFWLAERRRWQDGLELTPKDFETLMRFIHTSGEQTDAQ